jgi:hypothetical protein
VGELKEMKGRYIALFLISPGARRALGESGWEFSSASRLPRDLISSLARNLSLTKSDEYLGIEEFSGDQTKAIAVLDEHGEVESICFRLYSDTAHRSLVRELRLIKDQGIFEVFSPGDQ